MRMLAAILALIIPVVASATDQPATAGRYIVVLQKAGAATPVADEVKALGGTVEAVLRDRLVVSCTTTAIGRLRGVDGVSSIQQFVSQAPQTEQRVIEQQIALPQPVVADTSLTWRSGDYTYDGAGNIVTIGTSAAPGTQGYRTYGYDALSRLTSAQIGGVASGATYGYAYDVYGNRTGSTLNQQVMSAPTVDGTTNRLAGDGYDYDAAGNQTTNGTSVATWDGFAMMTSYRFGTTPANTNTYVYTANDERIGVLRGSEWTWTLRGPDGKPLRQYRSSTSPGATWIWVEDFVYRDGSLLASERASAEGGLRHYHLDHLGSARLVTSATGSLLSEHDYLPFGGERTEIDQHTALGFSREEPLRYTGHERDFEHAAPNDSSAYIDYMHARYYGPSTGRFLSVDPGGDVDLHQPQSWNKYTYVRNNPINNTDPTGRCTNSIVCLNYGFDQEITVTAPPPEMGSPWEEAVANVAVGMAAAAETAAFLAAGPAAAEAGLQETFPQMAVAFPLALGAVQSGATAAVASAEGRVFWSGGDLAKNTAANYARANGGSTLEMTASGKAMEQRIATVGWEAARTDAAAASRSWAQGAVGEVSVIQAARGVSMQSMWRTVEYPALVANPNVTAIRYFVATPSGKLMPVP